MRVGFTGTQRGLTEPQGQALAEWLVSGMLTDQVDDFHHGDCVGADATAGTTAWNAGHRVIVHPPDNPAKRAFRLPANEIREPKPYLERNHDIVDETELLIACPGEMTEQQRSGTWATVRYARKQGKPIMIIWPDGSVTREGGG